MQSSTLQRIQDEQTHVKQVSRVECASEIVLWGIIFTYPILNILIWYAYYNSITMTHTTAVSVILCRFLAVFTKQPLET